MTAFRTVDEVAAERNIAQRDCRDCARFERQGDGLDYGWCRAHRQFVKLYQMPEGFWSQCQFKSLTRERHGRESGGPDRTVPAAPTSTRRGRC